MSANEKAFLKAIACRKDVDLFRYLEVGCAYGVTCIGLSWHLDAVREGRWQSVMIDKKVGGWAYNPDACKACGRLWGSMIACGETLDNLEKGKIYLNDEGSDNFLPPCPDMFDLCLIDACHSKKCCTSDFMAVATIMKPSGFVFFHDADPVSQLIENQPHCNQPIGVREALKDLGILDNKLPGWSLIDDIQSTDHHVNRGCVVIQKHEYP